MDGIIPTQKSASVPLVMGMLMLMEMQRKGVTTLRSNVICVGLGLVMALADNGAERPLSFCSSRPLVAAST
jgi:hypothetical protein